MTGTKRRLSLALALLALLAAIVGAVGPAKAESATYVWPPVRLPEQNPARAWYTPLLLANRVPASIEVRLPCSVVPGIRRGSRSLTVLATARHPVRQDALTLVASGGQLRVFVGEERLAAAPWPPRACPTVLTATSGELGLGGERYRLRSRHPDGMPAVTALFSEVDLRQATGFRVEVKSRAYATTPSTRQVASWLAASLFAMVALAIALQPSPGGSRRFPRGALRAAQPVDAVVIGILLAWLVLSPAFVDDGWVWARQQSFFELGAFPSIYEGYGANLPLAYWLEWLQHWSTAATDHLALLRIPSLLALAATWPLARWSLRRALGRIEPSVARWALATGFLLLALAWGMTLRPEPFVCLFVTATLAAALSITRAAKPAALALGTLACVLAVTSHPAGITALAPLLVVSPTVVGAVRRRELRPASVAAVVTAASAIATVLLFLDTDVRSWLADRRLIEHSAYYRQDWWWEPARYLEMLSTRGWETPVRHLSVAALLLTVAAFFTRRRAPRQPSPLPARALSLSLALLVLTPSKNAWHFGALAGLGAVAIATESARLVSEARQGSNRRPVYGLAALLTVALWAASLDGAWNPLDLQTTSWTAVRLPLLHSREFFLPMAGAWLALIGSWLLLRKLTVRDDNLNRLPWTVAAWSLPAFGLVAISATVALLAWDTTRTGGWAPARQHLSALAGRGTCGLGESIARERPTAALSENGPAWVDPGIAMYLPCARRAAVRHGVVETPALVIEGPIGWSLPLRAKDSGSFAGVADVYRLRELKNFDARVQVYAVDQAVRGSVVAPARRLDAAVDLAVATR